MKNTLLAAVMLFAAAFFLNFDKININNAKTPPEDPKFTMPDNIKQIVDHSCIGCHGPDSRKAKAKLHLRFDELGELNTGKLVGKLSKIEKVLDKEKMPPKNFLEHNPDRAPTAEQRETLKNWAASTAQSLAGE